MNGPVLHANRFVALLGEWREPAKGSVRRPGYRALADRIELLIVDGRIVPESRLPAERELANALTLSRTTIASAYALLRERQVVRSVQGSGSIVTQPSGAPTRASSSGHTPGSELLDLVQACPPAWPGLAECLQRVAEQGPRLLEHPGYELQGIESLRSAIAQRYTRRGLPTQPDQVLVTTGAQSAIALIARALVMRGDRVLVESPTYPHAYEALRDFGGRLVSAPVSEAGWDLETFDAVFRRSVPTLAYLIPDFHNPTGRSMTAAERSHIIAAAAAVGTTLVVDETTAELDIDHGGEMLPFAASADPATAARILTLGSVGKTMWGGLRVGWVRGEPELLRRLAASRAIGDLGTPNVDQAIVADALERMDEIIEYRANALAHSRAVVEEQLARLIPEWSVPHVDGGVATWVNLGRPVSSRLALAARAHGVALTAGPKFGIDGAFERFIRIPITAEPDVIAEGIERLAQAWREVTRDDAPSALLAEALV